MAIQENKKTNCTLSYILAFTLYSMSGIMGLMVLLALWFIELRWEQCVALALYTALAFWVHKGGDDLMDAVCELKILEAQQEMLKEAK